jgi:hypothetical protein
VEADVKGFVGFLAPFAIIYMTWAAVTGEVASLRGPALKPVNVGQLGSVPKLPSAETELRDPFTPEGALGTSAFTSATTGSKNAADNETRPLRLDGTVIAGTLRFAIISGERVMEGDYIRGLKLEKVETSRVVLTGGSKETVLPLQIAKSDEIPATGTAATRGGSAAAPRLAPSASSDGAAKQSHGSTGRPLPPKIPPPKDAAPKRAVR